MPIKLPTWAPSIRPHQVAAIQEIIKAFNSGHRIVMLDAPTGSGKTLIGELVGQSLNARRLYLCSSLQLQEQFRRDFPEAAILMGRANYPTHDYSTRFPNLNAGDCVKERITFPGCSSCDVADDGHEGMHCPWCHEVEDCPYEVAKAKAIQSDLVCTNTSYFLYEANYVGMLPLMRDLVIIDEADTLEDVMLSFVEVHITAKRAKEWHLPPPERKTVESAWVEWAAESKHRLANRVVHGKSLEAIRERQILQRIRNNIERLNDPETGLAAGGWVYTGYKTGDITFKPVNIGHLTHDYLWRHAPRFLLMSATTISFDVMATTLGIS